MIKKLTVIVMYYLRWDPGTLGVKIVQQLRIVRMYTFYGNAGVAAVTGQSGTRHTERLIMSL